MVYLIDHAASAEKNLLKQKLVVTIPASNASTTSTSYPASTGSVLNVQTRKEVEKKAKSLPTFDGNSLKGL